MNTTNSSNGIYLQYLKCCNNEALLIQPKVYNLQNKKTKTKTVLICSSFHLNGHGYTEAN